MDNNEGTGTNCVVRWECYSDDVGNNAMLFLENKSTTKSCAIRHVLQMISGKQFSSGLGTCTLSYVLAVKDHLLRISYTGKVVIVGINTLRQAGNINTGMVGCSW